MSASNSPLTNIKVTNCVIRHIYFSTNDHAAIAFYIEVHKGKSLSNVEVSYNEIRDLYCTSGSYGTAIGFMFKSEDSGSSLQASVKEVAISNLKAPQPTKDVEYINIRDGASYTLSFENICMNFT